MRPLLLALTLLLGALPAFANTMYISDELLVPLRRGPSNGHRIVNAALPAGLKLDVLGEDTAAGFTQVRTPNGVEGWVPTQYLTAQPIARDRLAEASKRVESLEAQLKSLRDTYQDVRGARTEVEGRASQLTEENQQLQTQLAEIRRVSATAIAQHEENQTLRSSNTTLQGQVDALSSEVTQLKRNVQLRWMLAGGALVLLGIALGIWFKSRTKRSSWN